ncbi:MAG: hypothetical protein KDE35_12335 [Geminicoccaceae bacterium]|nr:hypothetical protein [Geminicoccaceae bacterium]
MKLDEPPAPPIDHQAARCRRLWAAVVLQQLIDARLPDRYAAVRDEARRWLSTPTAARDLVLEASGLDPPAFDRALPKLVEEWRRVDAGEIRRRMPAMAGRRDRR